MLNPAKCPECGSHHTENVHQEVFNDYIERVRICNECPTQYVINYGDPRIEDVTTHE